MGPVRRCRLLRSQSGAKRTSLPHRKMSAFDPKRTSASNSCCGSEACLIPYQCTRMNSYDAVSRALGVGMRRREFLGVLGGAAAWPMAARAQQPDKVRRIGVLIGFAESDPVAQAYSVAIRDGLHKLGWIEGGNIRIDIR